MDSTDIIRDLEEKDVIDVPSASFSFPDPTTTPSGFPAPKKRSSAFKRQRQGKPDAAAVAAPPPPPKYGPERPPQSRKHDPSPSVDDERRRIDEENRAVLNSMTPEEIAQAQRELYNNLDPKFIQMLLRRANLEDSTWSFDSPFDKERGYSKPEPANSKASDSKPQPTRRVTVEDAPDDDSGSLPKKVADLDLDGKAKTSNDDTTRDNQTSKSSKTVRFQEPVSESSEQTPPKDDPSTSNPAPPKPDSSTPKPLPFDEDAAPPVPPPNLFPAKDLPKVAAASKKNQQPKPPSQQPASSTTTTTDIPDIPHNTHFPRPPPVPDLDPADPDFLEKLHQKYFPDLPADPSKLAWMAPIPTPDSPADLESPYHPSQSSLPVSALRFDFRGRLIPPRLSRSLPVTLGLHHHAEAPEAAGYTIPELATLARSSYAPQRCLAYQTLGRIMYRLGKGEFGSGTQGRDGADEADLAVAIWRLMQQGRVVEGLEEEVASEGQRHRSAYCYAVEALWLLERGGWTKRWRAT
ncbi:hypothetical protein VTJ04DRAFT_7142 [Mycothermus thermophilus]|uniref:uncharacterized protein n=1 Tax=Humicola insolens TaxID=85995 RepID=UPI003742131C